MNGTCQYQRLSQLASVTRMSVANGTNSVEIGTNKLKERQKKLSDREELTQFKKTITFREEGILSAKHPCTNISQREDVEIRFLVARCLSQLCLVNCTNHRTDNFSLVICHKNSQIKMCHVYLQWKCDYHSHCIQHNFLNSGI